MDRGPGRDPTMLPGRAASVLGDLGAFHRTMMALLTNSPARTMSGDGGHRADCVDLEKDRCLEEANHQALRSANGIERDEEQRRERIGAEPGSLKTQGGICTGTRGHIETPRTWRQRRPLGAPIPTRLGACGLDWDLSKQAWSIRGQERDRSPDPENPSDQPPGDRRDGNGNGGTN
ncbi:hypothetical protein NDU88_003561 [Pleurodeles waltl]|uniref:Uncharacterized protein n=1 Tax=Pleurodeles waltl TaxID=8319 RepID=A0AAV7ME58_PLEWA|nr:hypothetical protein NDU88_003561 [Pleurodeles waltl]